MQPSHTARRRILSYDVIRLIAILFVVTVHVTARFLLNYDNDTAPYIISNLLTSVGHVSVPLFLMLSGALLLDENRPCDLKKTVKTAGIFFGLLTFWNVAYAAFHQIFLPLVRGNTMSDQNPVSLQGFLEALYNEHFHLWYLYVLVGLYLLTPLLRLFVKKENAPLLRWYILFSAGVTFCVPIFNVLINQFAGGENLLTGWVDKFGLSVLGEYVTYYLLGWYLAQNTPGKKARKAIYAAGGAGFLLVVLCNQFVANQNNQLFYAFQNNNSIGLLTMAAALFLFVHTALADKSWPRLEPVLGRLANLTFGVYLIHVFVLNVLVEFTAGIPTLLWIPLNILLTTVLSFAGAFVMSLIPGVKKLIRG